MRAGAMGRVVLLVAVALASSANAAEGDFGGADKESLASAKAHFAAGTSYFASRHYRDAVTEFLEAFRLTSAPDLLYNTGACYEALDDAGRATVYFQRYLAARAEAPERAEIEQSLYRFSSRVARLVIHPPLDASVFVDGIAVELPPPSPLPVTEGRHRIEARRGGKTIGAVEVTVAGGLSTDVALDAAVLVDAPSPPKRPWLWPVIGVGAGLVVAAIVVGILVGAGVGDVDNNAQGLARCQGQTGCVLINFAVPQ